MKRRKFLGLLGALGSVLLLGQVPTDACFMPTQSSAAIHMAPGLRDLMFTQLQKREMYYKKLFAVQELPELPDV